MQLSIGNNLKRLRKAQDITQEELAARLDITMLPALANFFAVTTDELIGMESINKRENMDDLHKTVNELQKAGKYEEAIALLKEKLKFFPNDNGLLSTLGITQVMAHCDATQAQPIYNEAIEHFERYLDIGRNEKFYSYVRAVLCFMYYNIGEYGKAGDMAKTLPHIWESREVLSIEILDGEEYVSALKRTATLALSILADKIDAIGNRGGMASAHIRRLVLGWPIEGDVTEKINTITEFVK